MLGSLITPSAILPISAFVGLWPAAATRPAMHAWTQQSASPVPLYSLMWGNTGHASWPPAILEGPTLWPVPRRRAAATARAFPARGFQSRP